MKKNKKKAKLGKFTKFTALTASLLVTLPCFCLVVLSILSISGVFPYLTNEIRHYSVSFTVGEEVIFSDIVKRGDLLTYHEKPSGSGIFLGWDYTGDKIPDILPQRVYMNIDAHAIFLK